MRDFDTALPKPLVSAEWLNDNLDTENLRIIDASWRMPGDGDAAENYRRSHIPGAVFFPIDEIADKASLFPHMLPSKDLFELSVGRLGISEKNWIVVYDDTGLFSAARVWWTFRTMGHKDVAVLDGGLPRWVRVGGEVTDVCSCPASVIYKANSASGVVASASDVRGALAEKTAIVLDARPKDRFEGKKPEPRPGLRRGSMPGAYNLPAGELVDNAGCLKSPDTLAALFAKAGVETERLVITTCGSGVTAAILSLALEVLGHTRSCLYDGSWAEWGRENNDPQKFPVETGG